MGLFDKMKKRRDEEDERKLKEVQERLEQKKADLRAKLKEAGLDDEAIEDILWGL